MEFNKYNNTLQQLNNFGLRDKIDQGSGLSQTNPYDPMITTLENTLVVDTRDCIGTKTLADARSWFKFIGGRTDAYGTIVSTTGIGITPVVVTFDSVLNLKDGDSVTFSQVKGNTNVNGVHTISSVTPGPNTAIISVGPNGNYAGGGVWTRSADNGYPTTTTNDSIITGNTIIVNLEKEIKLIRSLTLFHIVIPRDIIPLQYWLPDFIPVSIVNDTNVFIVNGSYIASNKYTTIIPQETKYMESRMIGFYSSPLDVWRTYNKGAFSMQNQVTSPPLNLWNPPGPGSWPLQPLPYPFQTVPTYRCNNFSIPGKTGFFHVVLSGYGVYDLVDWTSLTGVPATDRANTEYMRKLLLILICQAQSFRDIDYVDLILNSSTTSNLDPLQAYGFGDFQRYIPGPGIGQNYQPGTNFLYSIINGSGPPNVAQPDSPIPFPNFRGNVWGPYSSPGDRFQKLGLRDTVQDLYLNGDLNNLLGNPIINPDVPTEALSVDIAFGLNFDALITTTLGNVDKSTNPNILNAMRIAPNGFGAAVIRSEGGGTFYQSAYNNFFAIGAGGIGPSVLGTPSAWTNNGVYETVPGTGSFNDPIAQGPAGPNLSPYTTDASNPGTGTLPSHLSSFTDSGLNNGLFQQNIRNFIGYCVSDIPDTDLIIKLEEALRDERSQSTRSFNGDAILDCPIRLNLGSTSGTIEYIESLQSLLAQATGYWQKRYLNTKASLYKLHLNFFSYDGKIIPLEKMLQTRGVTDKLQLFIRIDSFFDRIFLPSSFFNFIFDPLNPQLYGRTKRYFQIIFKADVYQGMPPGLEANSFKHPPIVNNNEYFQSSQFS